MRRGRLIRHEEPGGASGGSFRPQRQLRDRDFDIGWLIRRPVVAMVDLGDRICPCLDLFGARQPQDFPALVRCGATT